MSSEYWPGNTAPPLPGGTHWVTRRDHRFPAVKWFLLSEIDPCVVPRWTQIEIESGIWPKPDAEMLARLHTDRSERAQEPADVQAEWIGIT